MQAASRTRLDARRFQSRAHTIHAQRALEYFSRPRAELRNIKRATRHAVSAADAMLLLEIDDPVHILNDRAIRRTRRQATGILAMHALIFPHEEHHPMLGMLVLVEPDQV